MVKSEKRSFFFSVSISFPIFEKLIVSPATKMAKLFKDVKGNVLCFDMEQGCCEDFGVQTDILTYEDTGIDGLDGYIFTGFYEEKEEESTSIYQKSSVRFDLECFNSKRSIYLFNIHNGYYGHQWTFLFNGKEMSGWL